MPAITPGSPQSADLGGDVGREEEHAESAYWPGTRVIVFDTRLYRDDRRTPLSVTLQPATVLAWYGRLYRKSGDLDLGPYPSLIDVRFDHDGRVSRAHFADRIYAKVIS